MDWNGRWQSLGGGGYAGSVSAPTEASPRDTPVRRRIPATPAAAARFGMTHAGRATPEPDIALQVDFANRSEHLMAVLGKQLVQAYYGQQPVYSYWNGCSTGGRQGLRMAQDFPGDYDGILAGAPAIHWDRFQAGQIWYQVVQFRDNGGPIGDGSTRFSAPRRAWPRAGPWLPATRWTASSTACSPIRAPARTAQRRRLDHAAATCSAERRTCLTPTEAWRSTTCGRVRSAARTGIGRELVRCRTGDTRPLNGQGNKRLWYAEYAGDRARTGSAA